ncbi:MAG TPA: hypothetical protein VGI74_19965 [Streptosporangiaceae bacterium]|jgi:hypothetical protein
MIVDERAELCSMKAARPVGRHRPRGSHAWRAGSFLRVIALRRVYDGRAHSRLKIQVAHMTGSRVTIGRSLKNLNF